MLKSLNKRKHYNFYNNEYYMNDAMMTKTMLCPNSKKRQLNNSLPLI